MTTDAMKTLLISSAMLVLCLAATGCSDDDAPQADAGKDAHAVDMPALDLMAKDGTPDGPALDISKADTVVAQDVGAGEDVAVSDSASNGFKCGAKSTCSLSQYCEKWVPGIQGGTFVGDSGVCPPDCLPVTGKPKECTCMSYTCKKRPTGCNQCSCITIPTSCSCTYSAASGGIFVDCYAP